MPNLTIYFSDSTNPWFNLATEDWLFANLAEDVIALFLWRNHKTVVIGRAQNPWLECNLEVMRKDDVALARRQSGGGAVFHDLGNTNFTFLTSKAHYNKTANLGIVAAALKSFGIVAYPSGRNDIHVKLNPGEERKISGSAFRETATKAFHHGTVLINVDMNQLSHYLAPRPKKLAAKGVTSVRSRVMNVADLNAAINHHTLSQALCEAFIQHYDQPAKIVHLDNQHLHSLPDLLQRYDMLSSWDWRFGKTLPFTQQIEQQFAWGNVIVQLAMDDAKIKHCQIFTDALYPEVLEAAAALLSGMLYEPAQLDHAMAPLFDKFPEQTDILRELNAWLKEAIA